MAVELRAELVAVETTEPLPLAVANTGRSGTVVGMGDDTDPDPGPDSVTDEEPGVSELSGGAVTARTVDWSVSVVTDLANYNEYRPIRLTLSLPSIE